MHATGIAIGCELSEGFSKQNHAPVETSDLEYMRELLLSQSHNRSIIGNMYGYCGPIIMHAWIQEVNVLLKSSERTIKQNYNYVFVSVRNRLTVLFIVHR